MLVCPSVYLYSIYEVRAHSSFTLCQHSRDNLANQLQSFTSISCIYVYINEININIRLAMHTQSKCLLVVHIIIISCDKTTRQFNISNCIFTPYQHIQQNFMHFFLFTRFCFMLIFFVSKLDLSFFLLHRFYNFILFYSLRSFFFCIHVGARIKLSSHLTITSDYWNRHAPQNEYNFQCRRWLHTQHEFF